MDSSTLSNFRWSVRVYYEDTDATGVVYHANYLKYFERGRTEWLRCLGFDQYQLAAEEGAAFTLASTAIDYLGPARLDDRLEVVTTVAEHSRVTLVFSQTIERDGECLTRASFRVVCVDGERFRPRRLPAAIIKALEERTA